MPLATSGEERHDNRLPDRLRFSEWIAPKPGGAGHPARHRGGGGRWAGDEDAYAKGPNLVAQCLAEGDDPSLGRTVDARGWHWHVGRKACDEGNRPTLRDDAREGCAGQDEWSREIDCYRALDLCTVNVHQITARQQSGGMDDYRGWTERLRNVIHKGISRGGISEVGGKGNGADP